MLARLISRPLDAGNRFRGEVVVYVVEVFAVEPATRDVGLGVSQNRGQVDVRRGE
jgi:hypothetical protein